MISAATLSFTDQAPTNRITGFYKTIGNRWRSTNATGRPPRPLITGPAHEGGQGRDTHRACSKYTSSRFADHPVEECGQGECDIVGSFVVPFYCQGAPHRYPGAFVLHCNVKDERSEDAWSEPARTWKEFATCVGFTKHRFPGGI